MSVVGSGQLAPLDLCALVDGRLRGVSGSIHHNGVGSRSLGCAACRAADAVLAVTERKYLPARACTSRSSSRSPVPMPARSERSRLKVRGSAPERSGLLYQRAVAVEGLAEGGAERDRVPFLAGAGAELVPGCQHFLSLGRERIHHRAMAPTVDRMADVPGDADQPVVVRRCVRRNRFLPSFARRAAMTRVLARIMPCAV